MVNNAVQSSKWKQEPEVAEVDEDQRDKPQRWLGYWQTIRQDKNKQKGDKTSQPAKTDKITEDKTKTSKAKPVGGLGAYNALCFELGSYMVGVKVIYFHGWLLSEVIAQVVTAALQAGHRPDRCKLAELFFFGGDMPVFHAMANYWGHRAALSILRGDDTTHMVGNHNVMNATSEQAGSVQPKSDSRAIRRPFLLSSFEPMLLWRKPPPVRRPQLLWSEQSDFWPPGG